MVSKKGCALLAIKLLTESGSFEKSFQYVHASKCTATPAKKPMWDTVRGILENMQREQIAEWKAEAKANGY